MKTLFKILRSTITSLLFLLLTVAIVVELIFMGLKLNTPNLPNLIDREALIEDALEASIENEQIHAIAVTFLDDYINYIFHKRSFPSMQTVDFSSLTDEQLPEAKRTITNLSEKINLPYEEVVDIRNANNVLSNGAIFLLINVGVFLVYIVTCIVMGSFKRGTKLLSISLIASSIIALLSKPIVLSKLAGHFSDGGNIFITHILNPTILSEFTRLAIIYLVLGLIMLGCFILYDRFKRKNL